MAVRRALILLAMILFLSAPAALAGTRRTDRNDSDHQTLANNPEFGAVGTLSAPGLGVGVFCSATLIDPHWIITAAHCAAGGTGTTVPLDPADLVFELPGGSFTPSINILHPDYDGVILNGSDIALMRFDNPINLVPSASINRSNDALGQAVTYVGHGLFGTGATGDNQGPVGTKRAGDNVQDIRGNSLGLPSHFLLSDFDNPADPSDNSLGGAGSSATPLDLEFALARNDSGGGAFLEVSPGVFELAGVHSFRTALLPPDGDGVINSDYGDLSGIVDLAAFAPWIDGTIASVPEPTTFLLVGIGGLAVTYVARRRSR